MVVPEEIYGRLQTVKIVGKSHGSNIWECICECGNITKVRSGQLSSGRTKSCGCLAIESRKKKKGRRKDLTGKTFGRLTVLSPEGISGGKQYLWKCICECGQYTIVAHGNLQNSHTKSCGCYSKDRLVEYNSTKVVSDITKAKLSAFFKGRPSGRKGIYNPSQETREKLRIAASGKKMSIESRKKLSDAIRGDKSCHWRGGVNDANDTIRKSLDFKLWREAVYKRDDFTCQNCHKRGGRLNPHHIQAFSLFIELRFDASNGITLCQSCHKELHKMDIPRVYKQV